MRVGKVPARLRNRQAGRGPLVGGGDLPRGAAPELARIFWEPDTRLGHGASGGSSIPDAPTPATTVCPRAAVAEGGNETVCLNCHS
jgi:hypothetical protein